MEPYPYRLEWSIWKEAAREFLLEKPRPLVSVDWDFFYQTPSREKFPDHIAEMMPSRVAIEEWFSAKRSLAHWQDLYERLEVIDFSPLEYFKEPQASELTFFAKKLKDSFLFDKVYIADSHAWGSWACLVAAAGHSTSITSFDAHHDCGYINYFPGDSEERSQARAMTRPSCDDWIQASLVHGQASSAEVIYPEFAKREWDIHEPTLPLSCWDKVDKTIFTHWPGRDERREATLLLVRSSAYSPPFFSWDDLFLDLAKMLAPEVICLDCLAPSGVQIGDHDACKTRI